MKDKKLCPLCGKPNKCKAGTDEKCWCVDFEFPAELIEQVHEHLFRKACICRDCVENFKAEPVKAKKKVLMSWSSGKDSAWALYQLQKDPRVELVGLFCTVNKKFDRVAMHGVRVELLKKQADALGLPIEILEIPYPCSNEAYEEVMRNFTERCKNNQVDTIAFGDLFLEDIRQYRVDKLKDTDLEPIFPIWGIPTKELAKTMIDSGLRTVITCLDPRKVPKELAGKEFSEDFLGKLPETVDPCGENGEFHSFVFAGPMFKNSIDIKVGEVVDREGFTFADISPL